VAILLWFAHFGMRIDGGAQLLTCSHLVHHTSIPLIFQVNLIGQRSCFGIIYIWLVKLEKSNLEIITMATWIWANQPIYSFLVGCLNLCLQETNVQVVSPQLATCMRFHQCPGSFGA
jgi:hypothetical protein